MPAVKDEELRGSWLHIDGPHAPKGRAKAVLKERKGSMGPDILYTPKHKGHSSECVLWLCGV